VYLCHLHRYADESWPCDECESDMPPREQPSTNAYRETTYQDAVTRLRHAMDALHDMPRARLWRQGAGRD